VGFDLVLADNLQILLDGQLALPEALRLLSCSHGV
jgi:hypothetical protein